MLPSLAELEKVSEKIREIPNKQGEYKRKVHYCCYLLGYKSGLRISEAISLDLSTKTQNGLYSVKTKGKKERFVFISKEVIRELKTNNWQPNQTNRWTFYHFLRKIKRELNISKNTELTPHTLRRAFTTYHAENGMPLPLLQKLLGHKSIRTTALYWQNIHRNGDNDDNDITDILAGKKWLENREKPPKPPIVENFPVIAKSPEPIIINKPIITEPKLIIKTNPQPIKIEPKPINYQPKIFTPNKSPISEIPPKALENFSRPEKIYFEKENFSLNDKPLIIRKQLPLINNRGEQPTEKEQAEAIAATEKQRADNYEKQLNHITETIKTAAQQFYQLQKQEYYKELEKERAKLEAKIIQTPPSKK